MRMKFIIMEEVIKIARKREDIFVVTKGTVKREGRYFINSFLQPC